MSYKTEVLHNRHEQVHVIGVHNQLSWGQTTARDASQMLPHTHTQRLNAEVIQNGGQGVTLPETYIQHERGTQTAVNSNSSTAIGSDILD